MTVDVVTFGCRLNALDSETIRAHAVAGGARELVVVNSCAVTAEAQRQARQAVRRAARERPDAEIVVTGCAAQIDPQGFAAMPEVARVVGAEAKTRAATWAPGVQPRVEVGDVMEARDVTRPPRDAAIKLPRAFVQVQTGCDHRCTFCVIPFGRGASRSTTAADVVAEVRRVVALGGAEVVLTGVDLTSWGADLPGAPALGALVRAILNGVPELRRLRLSSLDAVEVDEELVRAFAEEERLMPHLHLSLQSGDDMILKRMKRRHSRAEAVRFCERIRAARPDVAFGADLIAGFPTETEAMFQNSLRLIEDCDVAYAHVFAYSPRPGTPATRMPQVAAAAVKERAARLRERGGRALGRHLAARVGRRMRVLAEGGGVARAEDFSAVGLAREVPRGTFLEVDIVGHDDGRLIAA